MSTETLRRLHLSDMDRIKTMTHAKAKLAEQLVGNAQPQTPETLPVRIVHVYFD